MFRAKKEKGIPNNQVTKVNVWVVIFFYCVKNNAEINATTRL